MAAATIRASPEALLADAPAPDPLSGLVDIPLPTPVSLWPQTWPLRILIVLALAGLAYAALRSIQHWRANLYRREALSELKRIESGAAKLTPTELATALASLVRRTALAAFPREQAASLTGGDWLAFLDRTCAGGIFSEGAARALEISAYRPEPSMDPSALILAVRSWITMHRREPAP